MMSAIATIIDENEPDAIKKVIDTIEDPAGTFYRFSVPRSIIRRSIINKKKTEQAVE
jgi:F420-non-reducing hydrogenase small subunit